MSRTYRCPSCGHKITFDEAYIVSGRYCPECDHEVKIPYKYWLGIE